MGSQFNINLNCALSEGNKLLVSLQLIDDCSGRTLVSHQEEIQVTEFAWTIW